MTTPRGPRGAYAKSAERQAEITQAALQLIKERGHRNLTTAEVAARAGVSERSIFYHFPTRDHLLVAALELSEAETEDEMEGRHAPDPDDIDYIVSSLADINAQQEWKLQLTVALNAHAQDPSHPARGYFARHNQLAAAAFAELLIRRQARGLAHPDLEPDSIARRLLAVWDGLQAQWLVSPTFDLAHEIKESFRQLTGQNVMEVKQAIDHVLADA